MSSLPRSNRAASHVRFATLGSVTGPLPAVPDGVALMEELGVGRSCSEGCAAGLRCLGLTGVNGDRLESCQLPCDLRANPDDPSHDCPRPLECIIAFGDLSSGEVVSCNLSGMNWR